MYDNFKFIKQYRNEIGQMTYECICEGCGKKLIRHKRTDGRILCSTCGHRERTTKRAELIQEEAFRQLEMELVPDEEDKVNHPKHYCRDNAMESIDEMVAVFGAEKVMAFCICNVWKYRYRAGEKNGTEDLAKSDWYMQKYIELGNKYDC